MKVNKNSWHYKWLAFSSVMKHYEPFATNTEANEVTIQLRDGRSYLDIYGDGYYHHYKWMVPTNFCQYWRRVLISHPLHLVFNLILLSAIIFGLTLLIPIISSEFVSMLLGVGVFITAVLIIYSFVYGTGKVRKFLVGKIEKSEGLISNVYGSYKSNVCTMMEYTNEK